MYTKFFRLAQAPFSISPDPRYLFMSERHREALAHLLYGVDAGGGVVLLTGDIGTGKTTICRCFLEQVPANCNVAYIFNPKLTVIELLQSICEEFHVPLDKPNPGVKDHIDVLNRFLLAAHAEGRSNVLVIDEAQNLSADVLEQLRLLTNLETSERKLLQIILIGQPELRTILARPDLEQLAQRVIAHYHLTALSEDETASYIQHRMATAGLTTASPFQQPLMKQIHRLSAGVPRRINLLCDRALLGAYAKGSHEVDRGTIDEAASELFIHQRNGKDGEKRRRWPAVATLAAGLALIAAAWLVNEGSLLHNGSANAPAASASTAEAPAEPSNPVVNVVRSVLLEDSPPAEAAPQPGESPATTQAIFSVKNGSTRTGLRNEAEAIAQLGPYWRLDLAGDDPCGAARAKNVHCHRSNGGISELRQLDRPAMLKLYDQSNRPFYAMLAGLSDNTASLQVGDARQDVNLLTLARFFRSEFITLWRAPSGFDDTIEMGDHGPAVDWFAGELAKLHGAKPPAPDQPFTQKTLKQVRLFQQAHGLFVDGVIGPVTAMHINRAAGVDEPRLGAQATTAQRAE
ncbi:MAG TPA: AAA family ATPase [Noviherbaspirillum sp.]|nr:AAA family ATPase [Noviherbaspirillum sp.]